MLMWMPGPAEMLLIFLAVLLLFGAKRIPEIAQGLGKGIREFKRSLKETKDEVTSLESPREKGRDNGELEDRSRKEK